MHLDNVLRAQGKLYVMEKPVSRPESNSPERDFTQYFKYLADESDVMSILIFSTSPEFTGDLRVKSCHQVVKDMENQLGLYKHTGKLLIMQEIFSLKLRKGQSVKDHLIEVRRLFKCLSRLGYKMTQEELVYLMWFSLTKEIQDTASAYMKEPKKDVDKVHEDILASLEPVPAPADLMDTDVIDELGDLSCPECGSEDICEHSMNIDQIEIGLPDAPDWLFRAIFEISRVWSARLGQSALELVGKRSVGANKLGQKLSVRSFSSVRAINLGQTLQSAVSGQSEPGQCSVSTADRLLTPCTCDFKIVSRLSFMWVIAGDFNCMLFPHDALGGISRRNGDMDAFACCLEDIEVFDVNFTEVWKMDVQGTFMFRLTTKLKALKSPFRKLRSTNGNLTAKTVKLKEDLDIAQLAADLDPGNVLLEQDVARVREAYQSSCWVDFSAARQRAKVKWLTEGDANTRYFHRVIQERRHARYMYSVSNSDGVYVYDDEVSKAFISHFVAIIGTTDVTVNPTMDDSLFQNRLSIGDANHMIRPILDEEIRGAMFSIGNDKAPGSDGFSSKFFKAAWDVIASDVLVAIHNFFYRGRLAKELNHTLLCLLPKSHNASTVSDFRPIACCSVLYKCISKIIVERMKPYLDRLVSKAQSAFIPGRRIGDNILLAHELVTGYQSERGPPRCAFKIDLRKAYDMVSWDYLFGMLEGFRFHPVLVKWIKEMVSTPSFSVVVNGEARGFFLGKRGIRQGDPLSPYLFTLVMEGFSLILKRCIEEAASFGYHLGCQDLQITHLCFADDLFMFTKGDVQSVEVLKKALDLFALRSGLAPNLQKSDVFFGNVAPNVREMILQCLPFRAGTFPIRYLGVPLSPVPLKAADFGPLVSRIKLRIQNWKSKFLSLGGRKQLVVSVLQSLQLYWMAIFIIPSGVVHEIEKLFRDFI
ncbi:hypothetical protein OSB04_001696 [Centaurea solstitialis]|uniref:Reverse transcriptase domain-containing protein n=1 Tax=Centaurea solstitialis TaxID=347529 RepID=A0AA38WST9_9ASTR|nr:hypothetical protein OSB04_001696 [Centaurea solstitialis]